jgi:hypothetical protein
MVFGKGKSKVEPNVRNICFQVSHRKSFEREPLQVDTKVSHMSIVRPPFLHVERQSLA